MLAHYAGDVCVLSNGNQKSMSKTINYYYYRNRMSQGKGKQNESKKEEQLYQPCWMFPNFYLEHFHVEGCGECLLVLGGRERK